jgi:hypothetical protein
MPSDPQQADILPVALISLALAFVATLYPSWHASRVNPAEALRKMNEWAKGHFDLPVFHAFVKSVGIFPLGSLVRLESGLLAVVTESHEDALLTPVVKTFYCENRRERQRPHIVDLADSGCGDKIASWESQEKWRFPDLDDLWRTPVN